MRPQLQAPKPVLAAAIISYIYIIFTFLIIEHVATVPGPLACLAAALGP